MSKRTGLVAAVAAMLALGPGAIWLSSSRGTRPGTGGASGATGGSATAAGSSQPRTGDLQKPTGTASTLGDKVALAPAVTQGLLDFARKPWTQVPIKSDDHARTRATMRAIVGRVIDLDHAASRKSTRFRRTSYTNDVTRDVPLRLGDRWGPDGKPIGPQADGTAVTDPIRVVYREGEDGSSFSLAKMKEQTSAGTGLESALANQQTESFFVDNGLISETAIDRIEPFEVRERRVNTEAPEGGDGPDLLAEQDILLRRVYEGKQVINSHASVGVLPESGEVVQVKLERWTQTDPTGTTTIKEAQPDEQARQTASLLEEKLRRQIERDTGVALLSAQVEHVEEAWFQSDAGLIPVLVFVVKVVFVQDPKEARNLIVAINPSGDDSLIWDQGRITHGAPVAPTEP